MSKFLNISTDNTLGGSSASDDTVASQKAVKDYIDNRPVLTVDQTYDANSTNAQSGTAVAEAISSVKDNKSITENANNQLQTVGVIDQNDTTNAIKTWTGTLAEYNALKGITHTMYEWNTGQAPGEPIGYTEAQFPKINDLVYDSSYNIIGKIAHWYTSGNMVFLYLMSAEVSLIYRNEYDESTITIYENQIDANTLYNITDDTVNNDVLDVHTNYAKTGELLICWGVTSSKQISVDSSRIATWNVSLPQGVSFADTSYEVTATQGANVSYFANVNHVVQNKSTSGFDINAYSQAPSGTTSGNIIFRWIAIGKGA